MIIHQKRVAIKNARGKVITSSVTSWVDTSLKVLCLPYFFATGSRKKNIEKSGIFKNTVGCKIVTNEDVT